MVSFVDDFYVCNKPGNIIYDKTWILSEFQKLGWIINFEKKLFITDV